MRACSVKFLFHVWFFGLIFRGAWISPRQQAMAEKFAALKAQMKEDDDDHDEEIGGAE